MLVLDAIKSIHRDDHSCTGFPLKDPTVAERLLGNHDMISSILKRRIFQKMPDLAEPR